MKYFCPVCSYPDLKEAPFGAHGEPSHEICPRCGFEFGFDGGNDPKVFAQFREAWIKKGSPWFMKGKRP